MTVRPFEERDRAALQRMQGRYPYQDPAHPMIEGCMVAVDERDEPIAAVAAERIVQIYGWFDSDTPMLTRLAAIRALHGAMVPELAAKGYREANAFLPPAICAKFGRRLERSFNWVRNWNSWCFRF